MEVGVTKLCELLRILLFLTDDLFNQVSGFLKSVAVGVDAGTVDVIEIVIDEVLTQFPKAVFDFFVLCDDGHQFIPCHVCSL